MRNYRSNGCNITAKVKMANGEWEQERRVVARKPRDAAAILFGLKFADDIHYKYKCSQASKARR